MLTEKEKTELERLQTLWATQQATKAQILRCMDLERKAQAQSN